MIVYFINQSNFNEIIFDDFYILSSESLESTNMSGLPISLIRVFPGEADIRNHFRHIWIGQWLSVMRMSDSRKRLSRTSRTPKRPRPNTYLQPQEFNFKFIRNINHVIVILISAVGTNIHTNTFPSQILDKYWTRTNANTRVFSSQTKTELIAKTVAYSISVDNL